MLEDDIKAIDFLHRRDFFPDDNGAWQRIKAFLEAQNIAQNTAIEVPVYSGYCKLHCCFHPNNAPKVVQTKINGFDKWFNSVDILTKEPHTAEEILIIIWFGRIVWRAAKESDK